MKESKLPATELLPTPSDINTAYGDWFDARINEFANEHKGRFEPASMFKCRNGFFITLSFRQNVRADRTSSSTVNLSQKTELDVFNDLYNRVCRELIGRNYHRSSCDDLKPLAIACLDFNGSRYWRSMSELANPHIHSIWIFPDQTIIGFKKLLADENWVWSIKERFGLRELDIQPLNHDRRNQQGPSRVASYTAKFVAHNNQGLAISDDFRIFPT